MKYISRPVLIAALISSILSIGFSLASAGDWYETIKTKGDVIRAESKKTALPLPDLGIEDFSFTAWVKTHESGVIFSVSSPHGSGNGFGKLLYIPKNKLQLEVCSVGILRGKTILTDGMWHHVAAVGGGGIFSIYVDGQLEDHHNCRKTVEDRTGWVNKFGGYPRNNGTFDGLIDDVRFYERQLSKEEIDKLATADSDVEIEGLIAHWPLDGDYADRLSKLRDITPIGKIEYTEGRLGKAAKFSRDDLIEFQPTELRAKHPDNIALEEIYSSLSEEDKAAMATELAAGIWRPGWSTATPQAMAMRYVWALGTQIRLPHPPEHLAALRESARRVKSQEDLMRVRKIYNRILLRDQLLQMTKAERLDALAEAIDRLHRAENTKSLAPTYQSKFDTICEKKDRWLVLGIDRSLDESFDIGGWQQELADLRQLLMLLENPIRDFNKIVFVKRYTFTSSHFYTDHVDGARRPGGNISILDLETGEVKDLLPDMIHGVFGRFDLSFDAKKIVFDWKGDPDVGFRIYEVEIDGNGLRQLTFPPEDEEARIAKYDLNSGRRGAYHHQTDDMHPCYLPDGGICFSSSRCEYGILCNGEGELTTTVLYRMDGDGNNITKLTNSAVSEFSPTIMEDGSILYTRWEYVDKPHLPAKCLWAMKPDGTGSREIYGNNIMYPPSMVFARQIPGQSNQFVMIGAPHYPAAALGSVIRVDTTKNIRTTEPMTYITPWVDVRQEGGWNHLENGEWTTHSQGPLYEDPYPLSDSLFLVSHNQDKPWNTPNAYGIWVIDDLGNHVRIYQDETFSSWCPTPLRPRRRPPIQPSMCDRELAARGLAVCMVTDVTHGMEGVAEGEVKWIRVMEQIPRPWSCQRSWDGEPLTQLISGGSLAAKAMYGVVPVEEDGSAHFYVPADRNIYFQALDENFMELQRERTYINYRPGEQRSCIGCHETPNESPTMRTATPIALGRPPQMPQAQPGDKTARRTFYFPRDVQPVLDKYCVRCHGDQQPAANLDLRDELTDKASLSYEGLRQYISTCGEGAGFSGTVYYPAKSIGSHKSRLAYKLLTGCTGMERPLREMDFAAFVKIVTWIDANGVYYPSYWGRRDIRYKDHPNFRIDPTFEQAIGTVPPLPESER